MLLIDMFTKTLNNAMSYLKEELLKINSALNKDNLEESAKSALTTKKSDYEDEIKKLLEWLNLTNNFENLNNNEQNKKIEEIAQIWIEIIDSKYFGDPTKNKLTHIINENTSTEAVIELIKLFPLNKGRMAYPLDKHCKLLLVCIYNSSKQENTQKKLLLELEDVFKTIKHKYNPNDGTKLLPVSLRDIVLFMYSVINNEKVTETFEKHFSAPTSDIFPKNGIPQKIINAENEKIKTIQYLFSDFDKKEKGIIYLQRMIRKRQRSHEETHRIIDRYQDHILDKKTAKAEIRDANRPYIPKGCSKELAGRIIKAVENIELFNTVTHITHPSAIVNVFNDCLYGRRSLLKSYKIFEPAVLGGGDLSDGDGNVICLGPQNIETSSRWPKNIKIIFNLPRLDKKNHSIFFKLRDFGFNYNKDRVIKIGDTLITFSHTDSERLLFLDGKNHVAFKMQTTNENTNFKSDTYSLLRNSKFISYNYKNIHAILTLNFFRFIDTLKSYNSKTRVYDTTKYDRATTDEIYKAIGNLNDKELKELLINIGTNISDTAEFNFYGAHKIDLDSIESIEYDAHKLCMNDFIGSLNKGNLDLLKNTKAKIPMVFASYRFVDYLISKINPDLKLVKGELEKYLKECEFGSNLDKTIFENTSKSSTSNKHNKLKI